MRKSRRYWWLAATLILVSGLAGHVQAQGGWVQFVRQVVHTVQRTTQNLVAFFSVSESAQVVTEPEQAPIPDSSSVPRPSTTSATTPKSPVPQHPGPIPDWWDVLIRAAVTESPTNPVEPAVTAFIPDPNSDWSESVDVPDLQDFLTPPVPSYWDWDDEDWLDALASEFEEQTSFNVEWFQEQIRQEIERQSEGVQQYWETLEQLDNTFEELQLNE